MPGVTQSVTQAVDAGELANGRKRLTDAVVKQAPTRAHRYEIAEASGLAVRVSLNGAKTWVWRYRFRGKQKRLTLGAYPAMGLGEARIRLGEVQEKLAKGHDPADQRPPRDTVADLVEVYVERHARRLRTAKEEERRLRADVLPALGQVRLAELSRRQIGDLLHRKAEAAKARGGNGTTANRLHSLLQRLLNKGVEWGYLDANPADKVGRPVEESSRSRVFSDAELALLWERIGRLPDYRTRSVLQLLVLTGQRVGEVAGMTRAEVDLGAARWTLPAGRTKNGREHVVPLTAPALEVIGAALRASEGFEHLFPAPGGRRGPHLHRHSVEQAWRRLCGREEIGVIDATPHDVRRTVATRLADLGVQPHVVEALLNHVGGHRAGVAGIYNRARYETEMRVALERWTQCLINLLRMSARRVLDGKLAAE